MNAEGDMPELVEVLEVALSLDVEDRASLAQRLLASLDALSEDEVERLWGAEAQRRLKEYQAGRARAIPREEAVKKAETLFR